ncbi:MAG TPA: hypothetical protein VK590_04215 [Saprospiraceae bacterium]|nr:hypothetical protein [Saprospiraceae bacterium]
MKRISNSFILLFFGLTISFLTSCSKKEVIVIPTEQKLTGLWKNDDFIVKLDLYSGFSGQFFSQLVSDTLIQKWANVNWGNSSDGKVLLNLNYYSFSYDGGKTHFLSSSLPLTDHWVITFNSDDSFSATTDTYYLPNFQRIK